MALLAFDCCLNAVAVAVLAGERMTVASEAMNGGQAERLLPLIEATLATAGLGFADLSKVAVTLGPGGFTSVRVGIAAARGLALARSIPAVGQSSLEAIAAAAREEPPPSPFARIVAVIPAGRGGIYLQPFAADGAPVAPATVVEADAISGLAFAVGDVLAGPAAAQIGASHPGLATLPFVLPRADILARTAKHLTPQGELRPIYLRAADAKPQVGKALARATVA